MPMTTRKNINLINFDDTSIISTSKFTNSKIKDCFQAGDKVQVILDIHLFKKIQEGHGGWQPKMENVIFQFSFAIH